jgi:hypothetical protein
MDRRRYDWPSGTWDVVRAAYDISAEDVIAALRRTSERLRLNLQDKRPNKKCQISADMEDIFDE